MSTERSMGRRDFFRTTTGALAAGLSVSSVVTACTGHGASRLTIEEASHRVGGVPRRRLGKSGRQISVLIGGSDWAPEAIEAGILCGVNYWHKADRWEKGSGGRRATPQAILKDREAFYCEVIVDRVRGNHETGQIDEEAHYQFVKQAVARSGLRYFDDLKFHFGYHTVAELRENRGVIRAFARLKKEGLARYLSLSQHSYRGNSRVPGGENAPEILQAVMADGAYEHAQFFFSYGDTEAVNDFVHAARRNGFGTVAMKTTRGAGRMTQGAAFMKNFPAGTTPHHALARWLTTATDLDTAVIAIANLDQFVDTFSGAGKPMRSADTRALEQMTAYADGEVCRLCQECVEHCPNGVQIADILRYERYATDYGERRRARELYAYLAKKADACESCGACLPHCSQGLCIPEKLAQAHHLLA